MTVADCITAAAASCRREFPGGRFPTNRDELAEALEELFLFLSHVPANLRLHATAGMAAELVGRLPEDAEVWLQGAVRR